MTLEEFVTGSFLTEKQKNYAKRYMEMIIKKTKKNLEENTNYFDELKEGETKKNKE